jgi:hypothetical protein
MAESESWWSRNVTTLVGVLRNSSLELRDRYSRPMLRTSGAKVKYLGGQQLTVAALTNIRRRFTSSSSDGILNYDAVIIGGGPVGLALGCALSGFSYWSREATC